MTIVKLIKAKRQVKTLWAAMCEADGITACSQFCVFSPRNPHAVAYNKAFKAYWRMRRYATAEQLDKLAQAVR